METGKHHPKTVHTSAGVPLHMLEIPKNECPGSSIQHGMIEMARDAVPDSQQENNIHRVDSPKFF